VRDQFEELYTLCRDEAERTRFLDLLLAAARPLPPGHGSGLTLVLTLRADFFGQALSYRPFADALQEAQLNLGPMTHAELQEAIERPVQRLDVGIEEGLTTRLLNAVTARPGQLPLLEFALSLLWSAGRAGG
jgi:hypothetical protein